MVNGQKLFVDKTDKLWKQHTGERASFWVTMNYFIRTDGQAFTSPTLVHKISKINEGHILYLLDD